MCFRDEDRTNSGCIELAERRRRSRDVPTRQKKETKHSDKLLNSIRELQSEFNANWDSENIDGFVDVRQFQWNFWNRKMLEILNENEKAFVFMNERSTEYSPHTIDMCRNKILCFYTMADMYKNSIYKEISENDTEKSELTVLIGIDAIQKYRCSNFLRLWKIISWDHQRNHNVPTGDDFEETETLFTLNAKEFLNVIYDLRR